MASTLWKTKAMIRRPRSKPLAILIAGGATLLVTPSLRAQGLPPDASNPAPSKETAPAPTPAASSPAAPAASGWFSNVKLGAQLDAGFVLSPQRPSNANNVGSLFTDKANQAQLNQLLLTAQKPLDPKATGYDFGFKFQAMYGSDARYTHFLGELDQTIGQRYQLDVVEANLQAHLPWLTPGGIDVKAGQFPSPLGSETIDPSTNPFYSHSYIFNYGVPFKHTGILTTTHATSVVDLYLGVDSGVNTSLGGGDQNGEPGGIFGFGLNLLDGKLTILALSHVGPENPVLTTPHANSRMRYLNDVVVTYKATDKLSFTTEGNYIKDDAYRVEGYGAAQYASYALTDTVTLNGRAEVWRDNSGFFVATFPGNTDYVRSEAGLPNTSVAGKPTTYSEFTAGVTIKPSVPAAISTLLVRPELRYDRALNGSRPFNGGRSNGALTLAADIVLGF